MIGKVDITSSRCSVEDETLQRQEARLSGTALTLGPIRLTASVGLRSGGIWFLLSWQCQDDRVSRLRNSGGVFVLRTE